MGLGRRRMKRLTQVELQFNCFVGTCLAITVVFFCRIIFQYTHNGLCLLCLRLPLKVRAENINESMNADGDIELHTFIALRITRNKLCCIC